MIRTLTSRLLQAAGLLLSALLLMAAPVQAQVLNENFGAPVDGACPTVLPTGWKQFKGNALTHYSTQFTWPADNPGWAIFPLSGSMFPTGGQATNCGPMSSSSYDAPGPGNDWLVSPEVTIPANARLRYATWGTDEYEVRFTPTNVSIDAMLGNSTVLLTVPEEDEVRVSREIDLSGIAGQTGHIAFRNIGIRGFILIVDDVWLGPLPAGEVPITTVVTPADGSGGELVCPSGVAAGSSADCTAVAKPGFTFHYQQGIGGCDQPGDTLHPNKSRCTMSNVQEARTLTATFVPNLPPPTNIMIRPQGSGNVEISWTPPDTILPIFQYTVYAVGLPLGNPPVLLGSQCPENPTFPGPHIVTSCVVSNYQMNTAYALDIFVTDGWGFKGHSVNLGSSDAIQFATVDLPEGQATLRTHGVSQPPEDGTQPIACMLSGAPTVLTPDTAALTAAGAPSGATAPLGALQLEATGCVGQTMDVAIDYPPGSLAGLQPWAQHGTGWQAEGTISGDTVHYSFTFGVPGEVGGAGAMAKALEPGDLSVTLAPLAAPAALTVSGSIAGLTGDGLVLRNNGGDDLPVPAQTTSFAFPTPLGQDGVYAVTVQTPPAGQTCTVTNGSGTASANVTDVRVDCQTSAGPGAGGVQPVPTLGQWGVLLLSAMAGLLGWRVRRWL